MDLAMAKLCGDKIVEVRDTEGKIVVMGRVTGLVDEPALVLKYLNGQVGEHVISQCEVIPLADDVVDYLTKRKGIQ
jgi:hypothetical protein